MKQVGEVAGRPIVVGRASDFRKALSSTGDLALPFTQQEMDLLAGAGVSITEDSLVFLVKSMFPRAKLERIRCRTT